MNSEKIMDKTEMIFDSIISHLTLENCDHCKRLIKESFEKIEIKQIDVGPTIPNTQFKSSPIKEIEK